MELATWLECPQYSLRLNYMHISSPQPDGQSDFAPSEMLKNIVKESIHFQHLSASCQYFSTFEEDLACCSPAELLLHVVHILLTIFMQLNISHFYRAQLCLEQQLLYTKSQRVYV